MAKERLTQVLIHDRLGMPSALSDELREALIKALSPYLEIEKDRIDLRFDRERRLYILKATIPVRRVRTEAW